MASSTPWWSMLASEAWQLAALRAATQLPLMSGMKDHGTHCCDAMAAQLMHRCDVHADPADCPDVLVSYSERFDEYGLWIHDGGASTISISHCPWCGSKLPSRSTEWFEKLEQLGFDDPLSQDIPAEFQSSAWYRDVERRDAD